MKRTNTIYWITTAVFAAFMLSSSIPDIVVAPEVKAFINHLGYPDYFIPFIGVMKLLGVIAILVPGYPKIKEWAYAGIFFDLLGATYSQIVCDGFQIQILLMGLPVTLLTLSYKYHNKRMLNIGDVVRRVESLSMA